MKNIQELPDEARVWVYQSDRHLAEGEITDIRVGLSKFIEEWTSHGAQMDASFEIFHHRVLVIAADESRAAASGCGIDKSVNYVKSLGVHFGVDFFKRTLVLFLHQGQLSEAPLHEFWAKRKANIIDDATPVVDTTLRNVGQLRAGLLREFKESWHADMWGR